MNSIKMKIKFPKFVLFIGGLAILTIVGLTVYLVLQQTQLLTEAGATEEPKFINVTNEKNNSFTVAWITTKATQGSVILPKENLTYSESERTKTHIIKIDGLKAGSKYEFQILSGTILDDNQGANYEAFTSKYVYAGTNQLIFGRVFGRVSTVPLTDGFITLQAEVNNTKSNKIISALNDQGGWQLDKSLLINQNLIDRYDINQRSLVTLTIYSPEIVDPVIRTYDIKLSETLQILDIFLGEDVPWELPAIEDQTVQTQG